MQNNIVTPQQTRSIEKRNKIIEAGLQLFTEKGYYNTNTAEIAKQAGVSTGILYRYFADKKAIYLEAYQTTYENFYHTLLDQLQLLKNNFDIKDFLSYCIEYIISSHTSNRSVHEEFEAMSHYDADVAEIFQTIKEQAISEIASSLGALHFNTYHAHEKIHLIIDLMESYCHEVVYNKENCKDYSYLKNIIIDACFFILQQPEETHTADFSGSRDSRTKE